MKFTVEFNTTGFYIGQGIWEDLEEFSGMECDSAQEAIECAIDWMVEHDARYGEIDCDEIRAEYEEYAWRAAEEIETNYGIERGEWELRD